MPSTTLQARILLTATDKTGNALNTTKKNINSLEKSTRALKTRFTGLGKAVTGVNTKILSMAGVGGFGALLVGIVQTNEKMQTLKSSLKTVTGSSDAAATAFKKIENFSITTPFDLDQWTKGFIKMKSLGLDPSEKALTSYGNTAAAMGTSLNQMIEAVADASTGEFERLKEFGIKASSEGDKVKFTFQGVTTEVGKNAKEIVDYLTSIGNVNFAGAMKNQMDNLGPAFSNMHQAFQTLAVKIGESGLNDSVIKITRSITDFTNSLTGEKIQSIKESINLISKPFEHLADLVGTITTGWGSIFGTIGKSLIPDSGVKKKPVQDYKLGDFNRSGGNLKYLQQLKLMDSKYKDRTADKLDETNRLLRDLVEGSRRDNVTAVAG